MTDPPSIPIELNCDVGEGEPDYLTGALIGCVSSANIACGGHAGTRHTLNRCIDLAQRLGVNVGAHPGLPEAFGRGPSRVSADELRTLVLEQVGRFRDVARAHGAAFHHVKLHGTLYHATECDEELRAAFLTLMREEFPGAIVYGLAGGRTVAAARAMRLTAWDEAFADRGYRDDGSLVPRGEPGALITDRFAVADRLERFAAGRPILTQSGAELHLPARSVCIHADSVGSLALAMALRDALSGFSHGSGPAGI